MARNKDHCSSLTLPALSQTRATTTVNNNVRLRDGAGSRDRNHGISNVRLCFHVEGIQTDRRTGTAVVKRAMSLARRRGSDPVECLQQPIIVVNQSCRLAGPLALALFLAAPTIPILASPQAEGGISIADDENSIRMSDDEDIIDPPAPADEDDAEEEAKEEATDLSSR